MRDTILDWSLLMNLVRARSGMPLAAFQRLAGTDVQTLTRLGRGDVKQPLFAQGVRLLDIAAEYLTQDDWRRIRETPAPLVTMRAGTNFKAPAPGLDLRRGHVTRNAAKERIA